MQKSSATPSLLNLFDSIGLPVPALYLIDVGVSGGIDPAWRLWGDRLHALGVDALVKEVERLRSTETAANIHYEAALLMAPDGHTANADAPSNYALHRSSAYMGTLLHSLGRDKAAYVDPDQYLDLWQSVAAGEFRDPPREATYSDIDDRGADPFWGYYQRLFEQSIGLEDVEQSSRHETLDEVMRDSALEDIDLLKIDTDGYELDVLRGAQGTLDRGCLMVEVEVQFHGICGPGSNVFANVDTFLRDAGFTLLKLEPQSYGRSALPRPFAVTDLPAQTQGGPIQWADALYGRDLLKPDSASPCRDDRKIQVMACLLEAYGLECMAAELLFRYPSAFADQTSRIRDHLAARVYGANATYETVLRAMCRAAENFQGS